MAKLNLSLLDPDSTGKFKKKDEALPFTARSLLELYDQMYLLFAENKHSLLVILHGIDASGKDGVVNHIFSGANPQSLRVHSFKQPSDEELRHDFLWRCHKLAPESGSAVIFNRSYYEEVTTVRVHPEMLKRQHLPDAILRDPDFFQGRYRHINEFERMLSENGTQIVKFFLHISKDEQRERLKDRLQDKTKHWKFSPQDIKERRYWTAHMAAFQEMIECTNTRWAPWHVIPSNHKWYRNHLVSEILVKSLKGLKMKFPKATGGIDPRRLR